MDKQQFDETAAPESMASEQARDWLVFLASGEAAEDDRRRFDTWLSLSPLHRCAYRRALAVWNGASQLNADGLLPAGDTATLPPWRESSRKSKTAETQRWRKRHTAIVAWSLAACLMVAFFLSRSIWLPPQAPPATTYQTDIGQTRELSLEDGSTITLASGSRVAVSFSEQKRNVELQKGEAFFDIAADPARVFQVRAAHMNVEVLGTRFNINTHKRTVLLTVSEGLVNVTDVRQQQKREDRQPIQVVAGSQLNMPQDRTRPLRIEHVKAETAGAWRRGLLVYDHAALSNVLEDLARNFGLTLEVIDPDLNNIPVTAAFQMDAGKGIVAILSEVLNVEVVWQTPNRAIIKKRTL